MERVDPTDQGSGHILTSHLRVGPWCKGSDRTVGKKILTLFFIYLYDINIYIGESAQRAISKIKTII